MICNDAIRDRLQAIDWFANCGQPFTGTLVMNFQMVSSWQAASRYYHSSAWEATTLEARNVLTRYLSAHPSEAYSNWNKTALANKDLMLGILSPKLVSVKQQFDLDQRFVSCVEWDVLGAMMEVSYSHYKLPSTFFRELLRVYEAGHFPCGWVAGEWPNGKLVIL